VFGFFAIKLIPQGCELAGSFVCSITLTLNHVAICRFLTQGAQVLAKFFSVGNGSRTNRRLLFMEEPRYPRTVRSEVNFVVADNSSSSLPVASAKTFRNLKGNQGQ
jgi:hypothetical protein